MGTTEKSWLFTDVPVRKEADGKQARWFVELDGGIEIEVKPVNGMVLWMLYRSYTSLLPDPPVISMELEGVDAVQRMHDPSDEEYRKEEARIYTELDQQLMVEFMTGIVVPEGDEWAHAWTTLGRPLPPAGTPENDAIRIDLFLVLKGIRSHVDRQMIIRVIDAISQETPAAIERAQAFFRYYVGRSQTEEPADTGVEPTDDSEGRSDGGDVTLRTDGETVVQAADRREGDTDSLREEPQHEGVPKRARRQRSK